jgi:hypothetical protein
MWYVSFVSLRHPRTTIDPHALRRISPALDPIQRWCSPNLRRRHSRTRVRVTSTPTLVPLYRLSLPAHPYRKLDLSFRVLRSPHTHPRSPIPQRPHTRSRPLPHHRYRHKHLLMRTGRFGPKLVSPKSSPLGVPVIRSFLTAPTPATDRDPYL